MCNKNEFCEYMRKTKPDTHTQNKKLICDWTNKMKCLVDFGTLKFFVRHGMVVEKIHEIISLKQSKWLESCFSFNTKKQKGAKIDFEKDFYKLLVKAAFRKMMEIIRNSLR